MGDLTRDFSTHEFHCPCCGLFNMQPGFLTMLQDMRDLVGHPMVISSGSRCPKHNAHVGGAGGSAHLAGLAVDVSCPDNETRYRLMDAAIKIGMTGIGIYARHMHVDILDRTPRLIWYHP